LVKAVIRAATEKKISDMADNRVDATSGRALGVSPVEPSPSLSANVNDTKFGNHTNIHQGDQNIGQSRVHITYKNYGTWISPQTGNDAVFDSRGNVPGAPCWTVPFGRSKDFVGREAVLKQLLKIIPPDADKDDCQRTAIEGLGGVGKTQVALEAAFRVRDQYKDCHVFWVPAIDAATFENAYRQIGWELKIQDINNDKADVKSLVKTALSRSADKWLLIIDNADDVDLLCNSAKAVPLSDSLPFSLKGSIVFTTRNDEVSQKFDIRRESIIHLAEMSRPEAIDMLQKGLSANQISDTQSIASLLDFLTDLPLAIKQASAYMAKTGMMVTQYLTYCSSGDERLIELLSKDFEDRARYKSTRNPVATTWLISFSDISRDKPLAAKYLQSMSILAEKNIPKHLLPLHDDELEVYEAIGLLKAYAFISERADEKSYDIHRLVRLVMRNWLAKKGELKTCVTTVMDRLGTVYPHPDHANKDVWTRYLPHALVALEFQEHTADTNAKLRLLYDVSRSILLLGKYKDAEQVWRQTVDLYMKVLGVEHPYTLASRSYLAKTLYGQGRHEEAKQIHQQTLELRIKVLGAEHPDTLLSRTNLANTLYSKGQYKEAEQIYQHTLRLQIKVLGAEHPSTLFSMYYLASVFSRQGQYKEAGQTFQKTLELQIKVLGPEHHDTLFTMNGLAIILYLQGQYKEAEQIFQRTLELQIKVLGVEHPGTIYGLYNLACVSYRQGRYKEAEHTFQQTLELRVKALGPEHPDTVSSREKLDLCKKEQVLGAEHPDLLLSRESLAQCTKEQVLLAEHSDNLLRQVLDSDTAFNSENTISESKGFHFLRDWFRKE
jgi:tetratricopeptide (TPR) repeat protein